MNSDCPYRTCEYLSSEEVRNRFDVERTGIMNSLNKGLSLAPPWSIQSPSDVSEKTLALSEELKGTLVEWQRRAGDALAYAQSRHHAATEASREEFIKTMTARSKRDLTSKMFANWDWGNPLRSTLREYLGDDDPAFEHEDEAALTQAMLAFVWKDLFMSHGQLCDHVWTAARLVNQHDKGFPEGNIHHPQSPLTKPLSRGGYEGPFTANNGRVLASFRSTVPARFSVVPAVSSMQAP